MQSRHYWEARLERVPGLAGVGHRAFDERYNRWLYRALRDALTDVLDDHAVEVAGRRALDVGSGTGYWLDVLAERRPARLVALELTAVAAERLRARLPEVEVHHADVSEVALELPGPFDLVLAMSVLFHILDDAAFERALGNLARRLAPGGFLVISGVFRRRRLPTARHIRFRSLAAYREPLEREGLEIVEVRPALYLFLRTLVPVVGPALLRTLRAGAVLYRIDRALARRRVERGAGHRLLVAYRPL